MGSVGIVAAVWIAVAIPVAIVVGRLIGRRRREEEQAARHARPERPRDVEDRS